jgi:hypothetical protein
MTQRSRKQEDNVVESMLYMALERSQHDLEADLWRLEQGGVGRVGQRDRG